MKLVIIALGVLINSTGFTPIRGPRRPGSPRADLVTVTRLLLTTSMFYAMIGSFPTKAAVKSIRPFFSETGIRA